MKREKEGRKMKEERRRKPGVTGSNAPRKLGDERERGRPLASCGSNLAKKGGKKDKPHKERTGIERLQKQLRQHKQQQQKKQQKQQPTEEFARPKSGHKKKRDKMLDMPLSECRTKAYKDCLRALTVQKLDWKNQKLLANLRKTLHITNENHFKYREEVLKDPEIQSLMRALNSGGPSLKPPTDQPANIQNGVMPQAQAEVKEPTPKIKRPAKTISHPPTKGKVAQHSKYPSTNQSNSTTSSGGPSPNPHASTSTPSTPPQNLEYPNTHNVGSNGVNELIGRRVEGFWESYSPQWQEAVITDYDINSRKHCLTYDFNSHNESWEWVNLDKEIRTGQVRLLQGYTLDVEPQHPTAKRKATGLSKTNKVLGKRGRAEQNGKTVDLDQVSRHPPFESGFFLDKLRHGTLNELEILLTETRKRQKVVMGKLVDMGDDATRGADDLVKALIEREKLEQRLAKVNHQLKEIEADINRK